MLKIFSTVLAVGISMLLLVACGDGALKRHMTMSGVYAVEVKGWDVVCFLDADGPGMDCMKKSEVKLHGK